MIIHLFNHSQIFDPYAYSKAMFRVIEFETIDIKKQIAVIIREL